MHGAVQKTDNFERGDLAGRPGQHKAASLASAAVHKAAAPELVKDIFKKTRGNGLRFGNLLNARGAATRALGKLEQGAQTVLALK